MSGIVSYGAYVPKYRIDRKLIYKSMGWLNPATFMPGEKAVANYDEDSVTMAVAAGIDCLSGIERAGVDAVSLPLQHLPILNDRVPKLLQPLLTAGQISGPPILPTRSRREPRPSFPQLMQ